MQSEHAPPDIIKPGLEIVPPTNQQARQICNTTVTLFQKVIAPLNLYINQDFKAFLALIRQI